MVRPPLPHDSAFQPAKESRVRTRTQPYRPLSHGPKHPGQPPSPRHPARSLHPRHRERHRRGHPPFPCCPFTRVLLLAR
ncbi:hypothetical protein C8R44DRAFT_808715 [Mycena epipterygia]|nr:hypothetical protein C8R44DRAFT_808715 [Mycena epipterygia]